MKSHWSAILGVALLVSACDRHPEHHDGHGSASAEAVTTAECDACGMVVREQPAPRAQLIHRDGTRAYFCSIGDLLHYLAAPTRHGSPKAIFVEVLSPSEDPASPDTAPHAWQSATAAHYVVGVERPGVMGDAVLSYQTEDDAQASAKRHSGRLRTFEQLRQSVSSENYSK